VKLKNRGGYKMKHSVYFNGKVQSLGLMTEMGYTTIGVITPGNYTFSTATQERMVITSGVLNVKLPGEEWRKVKTNEEFMIKENVTFEVEASKDVSYICYYN
jgi:purine/pyrimidine-nucleoside phosphorylase